MAESRFADVVEALKSLTIPELLIVRNMAKHYIENPLHQPMTPDEQLIHRMMADGLLEELPPKNVDLSFVDNFEPIEIEGKPMSEWIIEERR